MWGGYILGVGVLYLAVKSGYIQFGKNPFFELTMENVQCNSSCNKSVRTQRIMTYVEGRAEARLRLGARAEARAEARPNEIYVASSY